MARIRTFKPEFFRSPDTAKASPQARLLFLAMWSWADDEGIGETNIYGLLGFAFPDSDDLTAKDLQRLLAEVRGSFGVQFYECRGRYFYAVPSWDKHQKTERRAHGKFPKPDDPDCVPDLRFGSSEDLRGNSAPAECGSFPGTGEQRNRGTEGGYVSTEGHQGGRPQCLRHPNENSRQNCPDCMRRREWDEAELARVKADELAQKRRRREAIDACGLCDQNGKRENMVGHLEPCPHPDNPDHLREVS